MARNTGQEKGRRMFQSFDGSSPQSSVRGGKASSPSSRSRLPPSHAQASGTPTSTAASTR